MRFTVDRLDTVILTVSDIELAAAWYQRVLGMEREDDGEGRTALKFGGQKVALHEVASGLRERKGGSSGFCFITAVRPEDVVGHLHSCGVVIEQGPCPGQGALGPFTRVICRDPDHNLVEIASYLT
jgi:catechol 2,3-dioxygenase-like lactoylglutathione lyase family enzyme